MNGINVCVENIKKCKIFILEVFLT